MKPHNEAVQRDVGNVAYGKWKMAAHFLMDVVTIYANIIFPLVGLKMTLICAQLLIIETYLTSLTLCSGGGLFVNEQNAI